MKELSLEERSKRFLDVSLEINELSKKYDDIDPKIGFRFQVMFRTFISLMNRSEGKDMSNLEAQIKVFEDMFDFDFEREVEKRVREIMVESDKKPKEDINKIDDEILSNIKKNISEYLKD